jgi:hypothetical protein
MDAGSLLPLRSFGQPESDAPAEQGGEEKKIEPRFLLVALYQPVEMDGSGRAGAVDQAMEADPVLAQRADRLLRRGEG